MEHTLTQRHEAKQVVEQFIHFNPAAAHTNRGAKLQRENARLFAKITDKKARLNWLSSSTPGVCLAVFLDGQSGFVPTFNLVIVTGRRFVFSTQEEAMIKACLLRLEFRRGMEHTIAMEETQP